MTKNSDHSTPAPNQSDPDGQVFVIGHPISHSRSPLIHMYWLKKHNISGAYDKLPVAPIELAEFVRRLKADAHQLGANVTIPHKELIKDYCDELTDTAQKIGATNTLFKQNGRLIGDNTDAYGFISNLEDLAPDWDNDLEEITILGAGGATRGLLYGLQQRTAARINLVNRTFDRAAALAAEFNADKSDQIGAFESNELAKLLPKTSLFINATSMGMNNDRHPNLDVSLLPNNAIVNDIVYTPLDTPLLKDARAAGLKCVDGLGMLLHQAVPGFEHWFGVRPSVDDKLRTIIIDDLVRAGQA